MQRILFPIRRANPLRNVAIKSHLNHGWARNLSTEASPHPPLHSAATAPQTAHAFSTHSVPVSSDSISNMFDSPPTAPPQPVAGAKPQSTEAKAPAAVSSGLSARSERFKYVTHPFFNRLRRVDSLSDQQRILIFLAAHTARGNLAAIARDWSFLEEENHAAGLEVIIQNIAYAGVPRVLNALNTVVDLGISNRVIVDCQPTTMEDRIRFRKMGEAEMHRIYGDKYQQYRARLAALHPALDNWMTEVTYGRIRGRPGLDRKTRQLCVLMAMAGGDVSFPQFRSMIIGALNTGATVEEVRGVLEATELIWGLQSQAVIDALWADLNKKKLQSIYERAREAEKKGVEGFSEDSSHHSPTLEKMQFKAADDQPWDGAVLPHYGGMFTAEEMRARATMNLLSQFRHVKDLPPHVRLMCLLSAQTASGNLTQVAKVWSLLEPRHHRMGMEAVLLSGTFSGVQRVVNALETIHTSSGVDPSAMAPYPPEQARNSDPIKVRQTGVALFDKIYRKQSPGLRKTSVALNALFLSHSRATECLYSFDCACLRAKMARVHPDVENIIIEFIYGRVLARECEGMEPLHRELCSVACMAGQIVFPQLHSHLLGALNCGATLDQVRGILDQTQHVWGRNNQAMVDGFWLDFVRHASKS